MRRARALVAGFVVGLVAASACSPVKEIGPTALVLEVYFSEARGTKALLVSGTAEVEGVLVNVFPTSQRPEELVGAAFPVPQTVRVLLNDSRAGQPLQLTVIGINADGAPVEAATQTVTPASQKETLVTLTLRPFTDTVEPDGGTPRDAGFTFDAGSRDAGVTCNCPTGCCDPFGRCATPFPLTLGSRQQLPVVLAGPVGQFCNDVCPFGKSSQFLGQQCLCGSSPPCGDGLRCSGTGASARCVCDAASGCRGCCSSGGVCETARSAACGSGGTSCKACEGIGNRCQLTGRCSINSCGPLSPTTTNQCCSANGMVSTQWPTCPSLSGDCFACDVRLSSACRPAQVNSGAVPCACGDAGQCSGDQLCLLIAGVPTCRAPF
ncbi:MAG: hypothetical protein Q8N26_13475 [Myxococcales bacterium]|nr:hypothetical protein [Myxococcales bacterium]